MGGLRLDQRRFRRIQIAARDRSLGKELLAAVHNALRQVQVGRRLRQIQLRLLVSSGTVRRVAVVVGALGGGVGTLVVQRRSLRSLFSSVASS